MNHHLHQSFQLPFTPSEQLQIVYEQHMIDQQPTITKELTRASLS